MQTKPEALPKTRVRTTRTVELTPAQLEAVLRDYFKLYNANVDFHLGDALHGVTLTEILEVDEAASNG